MELYILVFFFIVITSIQNSKIRSLAKKSTKYDELIMAVETKFIDETRHETALRYIRKAENRALTKAKG